MTTENCKYYITTHGILIPVVIEKYMYFSDTVEFCYITHDNIIISSDRQYDLEERNIPFKIISNYPFGFNEFKKITDKKMQLYYYQQYFNQNPYIFISKKISFFDLLDNIGNKIPKSMFYKEEIDHSTPSLTSIFIELHDLE